MKLDKIKSSEGLQIIGNKALCNSQIKNQHKFIFADLNFHSLVTNWSILLSKKSGWMAFGIAKKQRVIENNFKFAGSSDLFNHGCFLFSGNGFLWNCNSKIQNNIKIKDFVEPGTGDVINFKFNKISGILDISFNKFHTKIENISSDRDELCPCAIMMKFGDEITFSSSS